MKYIVTLNDKRARLSLLTSAKLRLRLRLLPLRLLPLLRHRLRLLLRPLRQAQAIR